MGIWQVGCQGSPWESLWIGGVSSQDSWTDKTAKVGMLWSHSSKEIVEEAPTAGDEMENIQSFLLGRGGEVMSLGTGLDL